MYRGDLTRVVISYELYETSLRRVSLISYKMTTNARFCLSYDSLILNIIALKVNIILIRKRVVEPVVVNDVTILAKALLHVCCLTIFMTRCYPLYNRDVI